MIENFSKIRRKGLKISILLVAFLFVVNFGSFAASEEGGSKTDFILHHIKNSHEWHIATFGHSHLTIPLPVIVYSSDRGLEFFMSSDFKNEHHEPVEFNGYKIDEHEHLVPVDESRSILDLSITKNVASMLISVALLFTVFLTVSSRYKKNPLSAPKGIQSLLEPIILFVRDEIAIPNIGKEKYMKFMPFLLSVFFFIWFNNLLGLLPASANLTGNIAVTLVLSLFTLFYTLRHSNKNYWAHIFNTPGVPWWLKLPVPLMPIVEFIGIFTKPLSLTIRLFANITAGHIIILSVISLIFIFESLYIGPVSVLFGLFMNFVELLVAFIQAFVFTLLSAIYFGQAVEEHHHEEHHREEEVGKVAA